MEADVLLIGATWRPRALIRAQLREDGYEVIALESWDEAELMLRKRAVRARVILFDLDDEEHPEAELTTLRRLASPDDVVVLTSASALTAARVRELGFPNVLARPYSVRDVISEVAKLKLPRESDRKKMTP